MSTTPHGNCPDDEVLLELAAGIGSQELAQQTMKHVAACHTCAASLRRYIADLSDEQSSENLLILKQLQSSTPKWQARLVAETVGRKRRFPWLKVAPAALALAIIVFALSFGPALVADYSAKKALKATAAAFTQRRTTETRLPGVAYSPFTPFPTTLGSESGRSLDTLPPSLQDASSAANQHLQEKNANPRWLQIQGRALLWEATPVSIEKAEKDFEKARAEGLNTPSLEIDLAASYFERDSRDETPPNLLRTIDLLNKVLSEPKLSNEDRASALYNLALAYEKSNQWDMTVETWKKYLQVDSSSRWAGEAQQHLKDATTKIHPSSRVEKDPREFLRQVSNKDVSVLADGYVDTAISLWLPDALKKKDDNSLNALRALATVLKQRHDDPWLSDLLAFLHPSDLPAVEALAVGIRNNGQSKRAESVAEARNAAQLFAQHKNSPGEFRAELQEVFSLRRNLDGAECLARVAPLWFRLSQTKYHWLQTQVAVEKAECSNLVGAFAESDAGLETSRQIARQFNFPLLELRNIGLSAGNKRLRGDCRESWNESVEGLGVYWQAAGTSSNLYQFYSVMLQCAIDDGHFYAGEAFLRHAIALRENSDIQKNSTIEAGLHLILANILSATEREIESRQERQKGERITTLPPNVALTLKLDQAQYLLQSGEAVRAFSALESLRAEVSPNPDKFFTLRLNQNLGNAYLKLGRFSEAATAYHGAIATSEASLDGIKKWDERLQWIHATEESYRGLVRALLMQNRAAEALEHWELFRSRSLLQGHSAVNSQPTGIYRPVSVEKISQHPQDVSIPRLVYADFKDGLNIWFSYNHHVDNRWVPIDRAEFENTVRDFVEKCTTDNSKLSEVQEEGSRLFAIMVQPVADMLPSSGTVIVELDQQAYNLPMEALRLPDQHYLGEKYSFVYSPGAWMEKTLRSPELINGRKSLLLLDASHAPDAGYLPGFESQRAAIGKFFPRARVIDTTRVGWSQTQAILPLSQIIVYMGHGKPEGSGTTLDYDSTRTLKSKDFSPELLRHSQMVVLAACSGAAGRQNGLADANNIVRAILGAGVPVVIASHWNVDSATTSQLMVSFYQHLTRNETAAQALYNARLEVLQVKAHPYFWAGFTLAGRAN
jgi:CHAT domain-containing protein